MQPTLLHQFGHSVELDSASADLFELGLEKEILARLAWIKDLFSGREELRWEFDELQREALELEAHLGLEERWELCARVRDIRARLLAEPSKKKVEPWFLGLCDCSYIYYNLKLKRMTSELIPNNIIVDFHRPLIEMDQLGINALKANADFLERKAAETDNEISRTILAVAAKKMREDIELEMVARN